MKQSKSLLILMLVFCNILISGQSFISNFVPSSGSSTSNLLFNVEPASGGNFIACGWIRELSSSTNTDAVITLFNDDGVTLWSRKHGDIGEIESATYATEINGNFYVLVWTDNGGVNLNEILILGLDANGNMLANWPKKYQTTLSTTTKYGYRIIQVGNHLVVSGSVSSNGYDNLLFAIDFNGNIVWDNTFDVDTDKGGYDLVQLSNGNLATAGLIYDGSNDSQLMITDSLGNLVSLYRYDYSGNDINATELIDLGQATGIILVGNVNSGTSRDIVASLVSYSGVVQWTKKYGLNSQDDIQHDAHLLSNGNIAIVGNTLNPNSSNSSRCALVLIIDNAGNIVTQGGYEPTNTSNENYRFLGITESPNGVLRIVGDGVTPTGGQDGLIFASVPYAGLSANCGYITTNLVSNAITVTKSNPAVTTNAGFGIGASTESVTVEIFVKSDFCGSLTSAEEIAAPGLQIQVIAYPNPAQESVTFQLSNYNSLAENKLTVLDNLGRVVVTATFTGNIYHLMLGKLADGVYHYNISGDFSGFLNGQFIIKND